MINRGRNPYECFKSDRERLYALISRDLRFVLIAAIAGVTGATPGLRAALVGWFF